MDVSKSRYLELLSNYFPNRFDVAAEIALSKAQLELPKPTELFVSDIHGEYEAFSHILRSACGGLQTLIDQVFGDLSAIPKKSFPLSLQKLKLRKNGTKKPFLNSWF